MPPGGYAGGYGGRQTGGYGYGGPQGFIGAGYGGGRGMGGYNGPQGAGMGAQQGGPVNTGPTQGPQGWLMYIDQESGDPYYHHPWSTRDPPRGRRGGSCTLTRSRVTRT